MLLFELWDDVMKQRAAQGNETEAKPNQAKQATKPTQPQKPMTAAERQAQQKQKREDEAAKRKADMQKRANHNGNRGSEEEGESQ